MSIDKLTIVSRVTGSAPPDLIELAISFVMADDTRPVSDKAVRIRVAEALRVWETRLRITAITNRHIFGAARLVEKLHALDPNAFIEQFGFMNPRRVGNLFFWRSRRRIYRARYRRSTEWATSFCVEARRLSTNGTSICFQRAWPDIQILRQQRDGRRQIPREMWLPVGQLVALEFRGMSTRSLTERHIEILKSLQDKVGEGTRQLLERAIGGTLPRQDIENVCQAINDEYLVRGIRDDYTPNEYGRELEALLDAVNRPRIV